MQPENENLPAVDDTITPETPTTAPVLDQPATVVPPSPAPTTFQPTSPEPAPAQPAAPVVGSIAPAAVSPPTSGKRKKLKLAAIIAAAVLLLGGGSAAAYYTVILPNQPERIAQQAITNTLDPAVAETAYFEGDVSFEGGEISQTISGITFKGSGSDTAMELTLDINTLLAKISLDVRSLDSKTLYLKLSGLNGADKLLAAYAGQAGSPEETAAIAGLLASVNDKWFMLDQSLLGQIDGGATSLADSNITTEDAKKIGEIYKKHQFLSIDKTLKPEDIHGVPSHHIQASINKAELTGLLNELKAANIQSLPVSQDTIDQISKLDLSKYPLDVWIAKKAKLITQLATTIEDTGTKYKIRVALFDYNKEVKIEKPADARSILELLGEAAPLAGGLLGAPSSSEATDLPAFEL